MMGHRKMATEKKNLFFMKGILLSLCAVAMMCAFAFYAHAGENLDDWQVRNALGDPQLTPSGTVLNVSANGAEGTQLGNLLKNFPGDIGILVDISVSTVEGSAGCGISEIVGSLSSGNFIQALIDVYEDGLEKTIRYRVREVKMVDNNPVEVKVLIYGFLGNSKNGWSTNESITVGLARLGDDVYFYTPANGAFAKVQVIQGMGPIDASAVIYCFAINGPNSIKASVSNVIIF